MALKPIARESMLKQLGEEDLSPLEIDLFNLNDVDLKKLYLRSQAVRSQEVNWGISKALDFQYALDNNRLQMVTFSDTYKLGVRPLTLKECLIIEASPDSKYRSDLWRYL